MSPAKKSKKKKATKKKATKKKVAKKQVAKKQAPKKQAPKKQAPKKQAPKQVGKARAATKTKKKAAKTLVAKTKTAGRSKANTSRSSATQRKPKRNRVLFVPPPEERRVPTGLGEWSPDWMCAGALPSRSSYIRQSLRSDLEIDWRAKLGARAGHAPIVSQDGLVYVPDREGGLYAFEAESGERALELHTAPIGEGSPVYPLVVQGLVPAERVPVCAPPLVAGWQLLFGDDEGIFYCVRRGDGRSTWRKAAPLSFAARKDRAYQAAFEHDGLAYTVDAEGNLYGVDTRNGKTKLSLYLRGRPTAPPALAADCVLAATRPGFPGEASRLHAIGLDGTRRWARELPGQPGSVLTASRETAFVGGAFGACAFAASNGRPAWTSPLDGRTLTANAVLGLSELHVTDGEDVLTLDPRTGKVLWWRRVGGKPVTGLVRAAGELWATSGGTLLAWNAKTGDPTARIPVPGTAVGGPIVAHGRLFVATTGGELVAYR